MKLKKLFRVFFRSDMNVTQVMSRWEELVDADDEYVKIFHDFVKSSTRGVCKKVRGTASVAAPTEE